MAKIKIYIKWGFIYPLPPYRWYFPLKTGASSSLSQKQPAKYSDEDYSSPRESTHEMQIISYLTSTNFKTFILNYSNCNRVQGNLLSMHKWPP